MAIVDERFSEVLASTGRTSPDVPGSTASILAALLGLAMGKMAVVISNGAPDLSHVILRLDDISEKLAASAERDRSNFRLYMDALQSHAGAKTIEEARTNATLEPLFASYLIVEGIELLAEVSDHIDSKVVSDLHGGAALLSAAFSSVMMAVEVNLQDHDDLRTDTAGDRSDLFDRRRAAAVRLMKPSAVSIPNS